MSPWTRIAAPSGRLSSFTRSCMQGDDQVVAIADAIETMRTAGHKHRDQAVLCTGNERLSSIGRDLERLGIPVLFLGSLFERPEVKDLLAILSLLVDARAMGVVRTGVLPQFPLSLGDVGAVIAALRNAEDGETPAGWSRVDPAVLSEPGRSSWAQLQAALAGFSLRSPTRGTCWPPFCWSGRE